VKDFKGRRDLQITAALFFPVDREQIELDHFFIRGTIEKSDWHRLEEPSLRSILGVSGASV